MLWNRPASIEISRRFQVNPCAITAWGFFCLDIKGSDDRQRPERDGFQFCDLIIVSECMKISVELLVNIAVKRLIDDTDLIRDLRAGRMKLKEDSCYISSRSK